jgi:hypothetical protein
MINNTDETCLGDLIRNEMENEMINEKIMLFRLNDLVVKFFSTKTPLTDLIEMENQKIMLFSTLKETLLHKFKTKTPLTMTSPGDSFNPLETDLLNEFCKKEKLYWTKENSIITFSTGKHTERTERTEHIQSINKEINKNVNNIKTECESAVIDPKVKILEKEIRDQVALFLESPIKYPEKIFLRSEVFCHYPSGYYTQGGYYVQRGDELWEIAQKIINEVFIEVNDKLELEKKRFGLNPGPLRKDADKRYIYIANKWVPMQYYFGVEPFMT